MMETVDCRELDEWNAFPEELKQRHRNRIYPTMHQRGAHYVVGSTADLMPCLDDIEARLKRGEKPWSEHFRNHRMRRAGGARKRPCPGVGISYTSGPSDSKAQVAEM